MNFLVLHWGAYTHKDILQTFSAMNIHVNVVDYVFKDKNHDDFFVSWFTSQLRNAHYDAVFTVNYFPLVAQVCAGLNIKYLSWCYDCPLNVYDIEETLGLHTNYVFLFDRVQVKHYTDMGFTNVYHLPLAVNSERLQSLRLTGEELAYYTSDISFVGKMYQSAFPMITEALDEYTRGYLSAIVNTQLKVYGAFLLENLLTDKLLSEINKQLVRVSFPYGEISKEQLLYAMATEITHNERLSLLKQLSDRHDLKLYSDTVPVSLENVVHRGTVKYLDEMPKVFAASKINLNITVKNTQSGMPLRTLDILGCGGFLLSNYQPELVEYFTPDVDFVYYESIEDALDKADYYLAHESHRQKIALNGYRKCHEQFNYIKQMSVLLDIARGK